MKSKWVMALACAIAVVVTVSVSIGLASPDGSMDGVERPRNSAIAPSPTPTPVPTGTEPTGTVPTADLAPIAVRGMWPGRPDRVRLAGHSIDWCPGVRTTGAAEAEQIFGAEAVDAAACAAVGFVLEERYSRLSLPRRSYEVSDFSGVLDSLTVATAQTYRQRISRFIAAPGCRDAAEALGLVLLRGEVSGDHSSAGSGRIFYGPALTTRGYRDRAVWINPTWTTVAISVDRAKAEPRIVAAFKASASLPVFDTSSKSDQMMTIETAATLYMRANGTKSWRVGGWTSLTTGTPTFHPLRVA